MQNTPAVQECRSEDAVEALDNGNIKGFLDHYSECQSHAPRAISSLGELQTHYRCHCAGNSMLPKQGATSPAS